MSKGWRERERERELGNTLALLLSQLINVTLDDRGVCNTPATWKILWVHIHVGEG